MSSSDYGHGRGLSVFAVTTTTLVLASILVGARVYCRYFVVGNVTWDDRTMVLAWLFAFFLSFTVNLGVFNGLGKYDAEISGDDWGTLYRCNYVFSILYNPALTTVKASILIFYLRIGGNTQPFLRLASRAMLVVVSLAGLCLCLMNIFQCRPIAAAWTSHPPEDENPHGYCIPLPIEFICSAPVNIITDLAILVLPLPVLTGLRLPLRQKTILILAFMLGIFATVVGVIRIVYLQYAITVTDDDPTYGSTTAYSRNVSLSFMWSAVEVNTSITCACIPTVKPLVVKICPNILFDMRGNGRLKGSRNSEAPLFPGRAKKATACLMPDNEATMSTTQSSMAQLGGMTNSHATGESGTYFGFMHMAKPKNMLESSAAESFKYCAMVSVLFFLWGMSYGLLDLLNGAVAAVNHPSVPKTLGLSTAYFGGGYFLGPILAGEWILRRDRHKLHDDDGIGGHKTAFIAGLSIYGVGTMIFWPSAVTGSYGGFLLSNLVVGLGLSVLEVAANSFMILCGAPKYSETRLLLAQGIQGVGSLASGLFAQKVLFKGISLSDGATLSRVQWTYLAITLLCAALAVFFYYVPLPETSDDELEEQSASHPNIDPKKRSIGGLQLRTISLIMVVFTQYIYVASQESNGFFLPRLLASRAPGDSDKPLGMALSIPDYMLLARTAWTVSRLALGLVTCLSLSNPRLPRPRTYLVISVVSCFVLSTLCAVLRPSNPNMLAILAVLVFFAEAPVWPILFVIGLRGQGRRTKRAAALITMGGSGAAFFPFIVYSITAAGGTVQTAYIVVVALLGATMVCPALLHMSRDARRLVDLY